jgi:hypothetical protein
MEELDTNRFKVLDQYEQMLHRLNELSDKQSPSERQEAFWRTLIWNAHEDSKYTAPDDFGDLYQEMTKSISRILDWKKTSDDPSHHQRVIPDGESMRYYKALLRHGFNRRFYITTRGNLASGPAHMHEDDMICVLLEAKVPVLLRPNGGMERWRDGEMEGWRGGSS